MGRKRQRRELNLYVGTSKVGHYTRAPSGATAFRYDPGWLASERAFPISLSMPLSDRIWSGAGVVDRGTVRDSPIFVIWQVSDMAVNIDMLPA